MEASADRHMVTIHKLEADEYGLLATIEEGYVPDPLNSIAIVACDGEKVVGRMLLVAPWHIEGTWIHKDARGGSTLFRMIRKMEETARERGFSKLFAYADKADVESYLQRLGYKPSPLTVWYKEL